jgi:hypothetical protein
MEERARAVEQIVSIARQHGLTAPEIATALGEAPVTTPQSRGRDVLVRVLGYLGGTFVFAGVGIFIALQWDSMSSAARVVITLGSGIAAFALAVLSNRDVRVSRVTTPLFLMAAALEPTGILVAFDEFGSGGDWRWAGLVTAGTMAAQCAATFASIRESVLLFLVLLFGALFWSTAFDLLDIDGAVIALVVGGSVVSSAVGVDRTEHRAITPVWYLIGAALFLYGLFDAVEGTPFEIVFLGAAAGFVHLSVVLHSRTLLLVATAAVLAYTAWFTGEHFADSVGWPLALVVLGLVMIGMSALAVRIDRKYVRG